MTNDSNNINVKDLQAFYNGSPQAKVVLDNFASFGKSRRTTKVDRLLSRLEELRKAMSRGDVISVLQRLGDSAAENSYPGERATPPASSGALA